MKPSPYTGRAFAAEPAADSPRLWRWLGVATTLVAALAWWSGREAPPAPAEQAPAFAPPLGPTPALPARAALPLVMAAAPAAATDRPAAAEACSGPRFDLLLAGQLHAQCTGPLRTLQNGSLRSYRAEPVGNTARWLQIDTAGGELVGVTVGRAAAAEYGCEGAGCVGVTLGEADFRGERVIALDSLRLARLTDALDAPDGPIDASTLVSAHLVSRVHSVPGDADACGAPSVVVNRAATAASQGFCAEDGMAVERGDDDGRIHRFTSIDGPPIVVSTSASGELLRIEFGALACNGPQCTGAELSTTGRDGPLELALNGTVLTAGDGRSAWASLRGHLRSP